MTVNQAAEQLLEIVERKTKDENTDLGKIRRKISGKCQVYCIDSIKIHVFMILGSLVAGETRRFKPNANALILFTRFTLIRASILYMD